MLLDVSVSNQKYIEDCEVCCNPIEVSGSFSNGTLVSFSCEDIAQ